MSTEGETGSMLPRKKQTGELHAARGLPAKGALDPLLTDAFLGGLPNLDDF